MRVLHIGKYFPPTKGGMERFLEDLVTAQRAAGLDSFAIVHKNRQIESASVRPWLRTVPVWREVAFAPLAPGFLSALNRAIDDWKPDYLHLHLPNLSAMVALVSKRARRLPWVIHWHSDVVSSEHSLALRLLYPFYRPFERGLLEHATLIVCTSHPYLETSEPLQAYREKCAVVPLGINLDRLQIDANNSEHPVDWRPGAFRLLAVGRLTYYKGFDTLIRAVAQCPAAELRIVGSGLEGPRLKLLIDTLQVSDRVFLEGALDDSACLARYRSADLFCIPSRERTEAFGLVALEAMIHKLPVLASALAGSGLVRVVQPGVTGRLAPVDEPAAWRDAIELIRESPQTLRAMGLAGSERVAANFAIAQIQMQLQRTIDSTLSPDAPRPEAHTRPLIVIPAKNEAASINAVVSAVRACGYTDVLVVDDESTDETGRIAREAGALVLRAPLSQGAWGAMQTGIRYAVRHNFTSVITMDADGQHQTEEIQRLLHASKFADVVIGACPSRGSAARKLAWLLFRRLTGFALEDLTSGFRLYNANACQILAGEAATLVDYQDMGVLLVLRRAGLTFCEVEVRMSARVDGISRIFYSWWAVARYMLETTVLCLAKRNFK
jgi:glycosyltransferase involved in cell wall biosynthesis